MDEFEFRWGGPDWLDVEEVARVLRYHPSTVYRWFRSGQLPGKRVGRYILIWRKGVPGLTGQYEDDMPEAAPEPPPPAADWASVVLARIQKNF